MATKIQAVAQLSEDTTKKLASSLTDWTDFLTTVGRLYKYPYHGPILIWPSALKSCLSRSGLSSGTDILLL